MFLPRSKSTVYVLQLSLHVLGSGSSSPGSHVVLAARKHFSLLPPLKGAMLSGVGLELFPPSAGGTGALQVVIV